MHCHAARRRPAAGRCSTPRAVAAAAALPDANPLRDVAVAAAVPDANPLRDVAVEAALLDADPPPAAAPRRRTLDMLREIAVFAVPVLMVPLADPMMSLIDTVALGQLAGVVELAALGPAALILNFTSYSLYSLSIATVTLTAERLRLGKGAEHVVSAALFVAAAAGLAVAALLVLGGLQLLAATGCDPSLLPASAIYLRIRALGAPAALVQSVAQAGLLGQRDSVTPLKIVLVSIFLSLMGDLLLIGGLRMGIAGAAWTTLAAQYMSAVLLVRALRRSRVRPALELPAWQEVKALLSVASTLGVFYVCKTTSYLMIQATTVRLPALLLAAHQPVWQLWGLASFTATPLEQASLAFIPSQGTRADRRHLAMLLLALGAVCGVTLTLVAHGLPALRPDLLVADPRLYAPMKSVWLPGSLALILCGLDVSSTGVLLAVKDNAYVARSMAVSMTVLAAFLWWARQHVPGLGAVWWSLTVFFGARTLQSLPRMLLRDLGPADEREAAPAALVAAPT